MKFLSPEVALYLYKSTIGPTRYSDGLNDFFVTVPRCYKDIYVNSFFPGLARLWNSLPIQFFPLTYNLNGVKSRIDKHLLIAGSF